MQEICSVGAGSLAKFQGVFGGVYGVLIGLAGLVSIGGPGGVGYFVGAVLGGAIVGAIVGAITALLYNVISGVIGGVEIDLQEAQPGELD